MSVGLGSCDGGGGEEQVAQDQQVAQDESSSHSSSEVYPSSVSSKCCVFIYFLPTRLCTPLETLR